MSATVLASLGEKDRFSLAAADVETVWASPEAVPATAENIAKAREFLDDRSSLGWTNLDRAFEAVLKKAAGRSANHLHRRRDRHGRRKRSEFVREKTGPAIEPSPSGRGQGEGRKCRDWR